MTHLLRISIFAALFVATLIAQTDPGAGPESDAAKALNDVKARPECDEFLPTKAPCAVKINLGAAKEDVHLSRAHSDVTINPAGEAAVWLEHGSPFMTCTLAASPAALARDASTSFTTFLGTLGTLGAIGGNPGFNTLNTQMQTLAENSRVLKNRATRAPADMELDQIDDAIGRIKEEVKAKQSDFDNTVLKDLQDITAVLKPILVYTFKDDKAFKAQSDALQPKLDAFVRKPIPNIASIQAELKALDTAMTQFHRKYDSTIQTGSDLAMRVATTDQAIDSVNGLASVVQDYFSDYLAKRTQIKKVDNLLIALKPPYTDQVLPMSLFSQKQVTEAITCKDVITQTQVFDTITFTAYYEKSPKFDFSAGPLVSLLRAHQVGSVSGPLMQTAPSTGSTGSAPIQSANTLLGVTNSAKVQVLPTAFLEYHPLNFHRPRVTNGAPTHPWGYVWSLGFAGGFTVNPYNGTPTAEFFEGFSFGIQRLAFFFGFHNGRYQDFSEGYYAGETLTASGITPLTVRRWTTHPAFGISYRIPLR